MNEHGHVLELLNQSMGMNSRPVICLESNGTTDLRFPFDAVAKLLEGISVEYLSMENIPLDDNVYL